MDINEAKILDSSEPLSKALDELMRSGTAVFVVKDGHLFGLIDDRNLRMGITNASKVKAENACVKCPSIRSDSSVQERIEAFLAGHFKSLPVVDGKGKILGATSRADLLRELLLRKLIPRTPVYQHMNKPVYTINYNQTIKDAKAMMKKFGVHHLVVMRGSNIDGIISTLDFAGLLIKPKGRQSYQLISEVKGLDSKRIDEIVRSNFVSIEETATLEDAANKMASESVSNIIVTAQKKPIGIIAATDIFKLVKSMYAQKQDIMVSGLDEDNLIYYGKIKEDLLSIVKKFESSLKMENLAVHIKKGKRYEASMSLDLNNKHVAFKCEGYNMPETLAAISKELKIMLEKAKSEKMKKKKPALELEEEE